MGAARFSADDWRRLEEGFERIRQAGPDARAALLEECAGRPDALRAELMALLEAAEPGRGAALEAPVMDALGFEVPGSFGPEHWIGVTLADRWRVEALINNNDKIWDAQAQQGNMILKGKYKESPENGRVEQELEVEFQHLAPGTTVAVSIDGMFIGNATAGADRVARLNIRKLVTPGPDGRPTGPRVNDGSILTVSKGGQSMSATFQPRP
ncbi:MAG: hypothetical protein O3A20_02380 [Planctomycetota bacterium]|nr:hypothetical protein [Planctomycetota bacterium]